MPCGWMLRGLFLAGLVACMACGGGGGGGGGDDGGGDDDDGPPPTITSVTPSTGFTTGGATIRARGSGFLAPGAGLPVVSVGGTTAGAVTVLGDTDLEFELPPGVAGTADVDVATNHGLGRLVQVFEYFTYPPSFPATGMRIETDSPGASESWLPHIACDGRTVHVTWADARNGAGDIYYQRSTDAGATWLPADRRLDTDLPGTGESWDPVICCDGSYVYVFWEDERDGEEDIRGNASVDGGATWLAADRRLDMDGAGVARSIWPTVCCEGAHVWVAWTDMRSGNEDIYLNRSSDAGTSWLGTDVRVDHDPVNGVAWTPRLGCNGQTLYLVWWDDSNGHWDILFNRSTDGGATWSATDRRLDTDAPGAANSYTPSLAWEGSRLYVVWTDDRNAPSVSPTPSDVYLNRSEDGGATWLPSDLRINTDLPAAAQRGEAQTCCSGDHVYVAWGDDRDGYDDVYVRSSADGGVTWQATEQRVDTDAAGSALSQRLRIVCDGPNAFVAWHDARSPGPGKYLNATSDHGLTWLASDLLISPTGGAIYGQGLEITCSEAQAYAVWLARPLGTELDLYFTASSP